MNAVLAAVFADHKSAESVRTRLIGDGFPTDRVRLTSRQEPGPAKVVPSADPDEKLRQYFEQLFPERQALVNRLQTDVSAGKAVLAVLPRGQVETDRAVQILNQGGPIELRSADLDKQSMEHAAAKDESSALSWIGRVMVAPQAPDR